MQSKRLVFATLVTCTLTLAGSLSAQAQTSVTGYLQAEWQHYDQTINNDDRAFYSNLVRNLFLIRRGRIKLTHQTEDFKAVVEGDFTDRGVSAKDVYLTAGLLEDDLLNVTVGVFKRPNYEVEVSSSKREATERSQVIRAFYPGERDLGFKLESTPKLGEDFRPTIQLGMFNGTTQETDPLKDIIARVTLPLPLGDDSKVKATVGGTFYYGGIPQPEDTVVKFENEKQILAFEDGSDSWRGWGNRRHAGVEAQVEADILPFGTTKLHGEFLTGTRPSAIVREALRAVQSGDSTVIQPVAIPTVLLRNQMGYYVALTQGLGKKYQASIRYDFYDRNTDLSGEENGLAPSDRSSSVLGFGLLGTFGPVRITAWYEIPTYGSGEATYLDDNGDLKSEDLKDNKTTVRFQYLLK